MPGLPGSAWSVGSFCDCASFHASACSRPPLPSKRMFMSTSSQYDPSGRLLAEDVAGDNAPAFSITEISAMLKRNVEDRFGEYERASGSEECISTCRSLGWPYY